MFENTQPSVHTRPTLPRNTKHIPVPLLTKTKCTPKLLRKYNNHSTLNTHSMQHCHWDEGTSPHTYTQITSFHNTIHHYHNTHCNYPPQYHSDKHKPYYPQSFHTNHNHIVSSYSRFKTTPLTTSTQTSQHSLQGPQTSHTIRQ